MMNIRAITLFWACLVIAGATLLWRAGMMVSAATQLPFPHGSRLVFGLCVTGGVVAFTLAALRGERQARWAPLDNVALFHTGIGFASYAGVAFLGIMALLLTGLVDIDVQLSSDAAFGFAYLLVLVFLSEALPEELLFRGWLMQKLGGFRAPWGAVLGQAALFTLFGWAVGAVASVGDASFILCFGLVLGIIRAVAGMIWASLGVHVAFIAAQQSALPQWAIWSSDPHAVVQTLGLAIIPFSIFVAALFGRVDARPRYRTGA